MKEDNYTTITLTSSINIKPSNLRGDINKIILNILKNRFEGICNKDGYIIKDSIELIERSIGEILTITNESIINYKVTYKADIIFPSEGDEYACYVDTINKFGIIAYLKLSDGDTLKESPFIIIIPKEYIPDDEYNKININEKLSVRIKSFRIKYNSSHIQVVATLV
tara:strand:+ start:1144 stop:1644 length:501 start_codon:yes stop_codon:yes gene_type:complete